MLKWRPFRSTLTFARKLVLALASVPFPLRGKGGVPWVQIMENELECLGDRKGHDGH